MKIDKFCMFTSNVAPIRQQLQKQEKNEANKIYGANIFLSRL